MTLADKIYTARKKAGLSQEALAERIGVSRQAISKWETGEAVPELSKVASLVRELNVSADWLLSEEEEPEQAASPSQGPSGYPEWLDHLPDFLLRLFRRFGWIIGVYIAVVGGIFSGMGFLGKFMLRSMFGSFDPFFNSSGIGGVQDVFGGFIQNNPVNSLCSILIVFGFLLILGGIILAVALKRSGK